jgi:hypothetical protein
LFSGEVRQQPRCPKCYYHRSVSALAGAQPKEVGAGAPRAPRLVSFAAVAAVRGHRPPVYVSTAALEYFWGGAGGLSPVLWIFPRLISFAYWVLVLRARTRNFPRSVLTNLLPPPSSLLSSTYFGLARSATVAWKVVSFPERVRSACAKEWRSSSGSPAARSLAA